MTKRKGENKVRTKDRLVQIFHVFFFGIFYYLLILAIGNMNLQSPLSAFVIIPLFLFLYYVVKIKGFPTVASKKAWYVLQSVSCIVMLIIAFGLEVDLTWDWGRLLITAYNYTMTGEIDYPEYFMRYPNNQFWLVCLIAFFKGIAKCTARETIGVFKTISMIIGVLLAQTGIYFIYRSAKLLWDETRAFWVGMAALLYMPFYLYAEYLYNDIPGMCITAILIYFAMKLEQEQTWIRKLLYAGIIGVLGAFTMHIKLIPFIIFIAILISGLLKNKLKSFFILYGVILLCFVGSYQLLEIPVNKLFWEYHFGLYPLLVIFFAVEFLCFLPVVGKVFSFLGRHSANIFYIHSFFMMFSGFIYKLPYFLISYIVLMGVSLGASMLIEALKEVFGYDKKFFKGG